MSNASFLDPGSTNGWKQRRRSGISTPTTTLVEAYYNYYCLLSSGWVLCSKANSVNYSSPGRPTPFFSPFRPRSYSTICEWMLPLQSPVYNAISLCPWAFLSFVPRWKCTGCFFMLLGCGSRVGSWEALVFDIPQRTRKVILWKDSFYCRCFLFSFSLFFWRVDRLFIIQLSRELREDLSIWTNRERISSFFQRSKDVLYLSHTIILFDRLNEIQQNLVERISPYHTLGLNVWYTM